MGAWNDRVADKMQERRTRRTADHDKITSLCRYLNDPHAARQNGEELGRDNMLASLHLSGEQVFSFTVDDGLIIVTSDGKATNFSEEEKALDHMATLMAVATENKQKG